MKLDTKTSLLLTTILVFFFRIYSFYTPILDVDETIFGTFASSMLHSGTPYIDAADIKPPIIFFFYYIVWLIFGEHNMVAMHIITAAWIVATAYVVGMTGSKIANKKVGNVAMLIYGVGTTLGEPKLLASNINILMALPLSLSFYFFIAADDEDRWWRWVFCGAFAAIASLFRYQGGIILVVTVLCTMFGVAAVSRKILRILLLAAGFVAVYLATATYLYAIGAFDDAVFWSLIYGLGYASKGVEFSFLARFLFKTSCYILTVLPIFAAAIYWLCRALRERSFGRASLYLSVWFILTWWPVCLGRRFYSHYFLMLLPPLSIMAAWGFESLKSSKAKKMFVSCMMIWTCVFFLTRIDQIGLRQIFGIHPSDWAEISALQCPVGKYINEKTSPDEKIFVWGFAAPIYFCSERLPASRFISADGLVGRTSGGTRYKIQNEDRLNQGPEEIKLWDNLFDDFEKTPPAYIVDVSASKFGAFKEYPPEKYPISKWMKDHGYKMEAIVKGARLFRSQ